MANNIEDFILKFVFNDDNSVKKIRKLAKDLDNMEVKSKRNARSDTDRAKKKSAQNKRELREQKELLKFQDAVSKEKLRDTKAQLAAQARLNRAEGKKRSSSFNAETDPRLRAVKRSSNFRNLQSGGIEEKAYAAKMFSNMEQNLGRNTKAATEAFRDQKAELNRVSRAYVRNTKQSLGLTTVQKGLNDSTRNLIRGYASLYAVVGSVSAINRAGQTLESMRASMLLTSADAEQVGKNLEFVEAQSIRLGLSLGESSKAFVRFASAAKGNLEQAAIEDVFLGIAEAGTVSQLTTDDMNGAFRA